MPCPPATRPAQDLLVTSAIDGTMVRWNLTDHSSESSIEAPPTFTMALCAPMSPGRANGTILSWPDLAKLHGALAEQVNVYDAKSHLSQLLARVEAGEEIIIARNGRPVARLVPAQRQGSRRTPGSLRGHIWTAPDFDKPDDDLISSFYEGPILPEEKDA